MTEDGAVNEAETVLDHLLLGIPDLEQGIQWVREKTGVSAAFGGSHPGAGTHNGLLSLGNHQYLEIVSIDPKQTTASHTASLIKQRSSPGLITWAVATADILSIAETASNAGYGFDGPTEGSRRKPDGDILRWKTLRIISDLGDVIPFFIEWGRGIAHPSEDSPSGCRLMRLEITHPYASHVSEVLLALGIQATVHAGTSSLIEATIESPKGEVQI